MRASKNKVKILITGGTGFIGKHLVKTLCKKEHTVKVLVRKSSDVSWLKELNAELVYGDILNEESLFKACEGIEVVYHLSAKLGQWRVQEEEIYRVNVEGTKNLLDACLKNRISQFVFCSTPGVIGKTGDKAAKEDLPYNPPYIYEKTKVEAEKLVIKYHREKGLPITIIRPDFVYGPHDLRRLKLYRALKNNKFLIVGNGKAYLHPTYIDDVIQGFELVMNNPKANGEIYNIAGPRPLTVNEYVETICEVLKVRVPRFKVPKIVAKGAALVLEGLSYFTGKEPFISQSKINFLTISHGSDISKAKTQLGYSPQFEFKEGIERTIKWCYQYNLL
ncbi:MAG: NAD-dependent epimerase/dehydratase family protein [bacterium]